MQRSNHVCAPLVGLSCLFFVVACADEPSTVGVNSDLSTQLDSEVGGDDLGGADPGVEDTAPDGTDVAGPEVAVDTSAGDIPAETAPDAGPAQDTMETLSDAPSDVADVDGGGDEVGDLDVEVGAGDIVGELPTDNCGELGIAPYWEGSWTGSIAYDVDSGGLLNPEQGDLPVYGSLNFGISCLNSKFIVNGLMSGEAEVPGFEPVPFELSLSGYYNPETGALDADITDGAVTILDSIVICFIGAFNGTLDQDTFTGDWSGDATGTNTPFLSGIASGAGDWSAQSVVDPPVLPPASDPVECTTPATPPSP